VPAGLDGNPHPVVSVARTRVLEAVAERVFTCGRDRVLVGVDGRSGVGKSTFADELAGAIEAHGVPTLRSTTDLFHRPLVERMRQGPTSPKGYYEDSHQLDVVGDELLAPFRDGARSVLIGAFDEPSDRPERRAATVPERAVLVFDGLFLRRPELHGFWDLCALLVADRRGDAAWLDFLESDLPSDASARAAELDRRLERARWPRYRAGWRIYAESVQNTPADVVIGNEDLAAPSILARPSPSA
jgi:uridine kinase